jgi:hypothetical protein
MLIYSNFIYGNHPSRFQRFQAVVMVYDRWIFVLGIKCQSIDNFLHNNKISIFRLYGKIYFSTNYCDQSSRQYDHNNSGSVGFVLS